MTIPTFIGQYDDVLSQADCDILIDEFEKHPNKIEGYVWTEEGTSYHPERKKAKELQSEIEVMLKDMFGSLDKVPASYKKKYNIK